MEIEGSESAAASATAEQYVADYVMMFDLISKLVKVMTETEVVEQIFDLFSMLFAPHSLVYVPVVGGNLGKIQSRPASLTKSETIMKGLANLDAAYAWTESGSGFLLRICHQQETLALLAVEGISFPEYKDYYLNLALTIVDVCGLAIANARTYQQISQAEEENRKLNNTLERRVGERTAQLEAAYKELEDAAYTISHDLRSPLRAIDGYSQILLEDYAGQLPAEARGYLNRMSHNAQRMGELIDGLLAFLHLGHRPLSEKTVSPGDIVHQALSDLQSKLDGRSVDLMIGPMPDCQADPELLRQVYLQLLSNALKYTRRQAAAKIEIDWTDVDGQPVYFIKDNGVGFDMKYAQKLFGLFQQLHRVEAYEGNGIGLALVQRIIQRHGGRIWAVGAVDRGATFYFVLKD